MKSIILRTKSFMPERDISFGLLFVYAVFLSIFTIVLIYYAYLNHLENIRLLQEKDLLLTQLDALTSQLKLAKQHLANLNSSQITEKMLTKSVSGSKVVDKVVLDFVTSSMVVLSAFVLCWVWINSGWFPTYPLWYGVKVVKLFNDSGYEFLFIQTETDRVEIFVRLVTVVASCYSTDLSNSFLPINVLITNHPELIPFVRLALKTYFNMRFLKSDEIDERW